MKYYKTKNTIGEIITYKLLLTYTHNSGKCLKLLQGLESSRKQHYVAWGVNDTMTIVELLTPKGNPRRGGGVLKHFQNMIDNLDKIEFK